MVRCHFQVSFKMASNNVNTELKTLLQHQIYVRLGYVFFSLHQRGQVLVKFKYTFLGCWV